MTIPAGRDERLTAVVRGEVQGVGFRFFVMRRANGLGLRGYVRNRADGGVEVVAEGPRARLEQLLRELYRGPSGAVVTDVEERWSDATGTFSGFVIRN
jgi:acylphosphatase